MRSVGQGDEAQEWIAGGPDDWHTLVSGSRFVVGMRRLQTQTVISFSGQACCGVLQATFSNPARGRAAREEQGTEGKRKKNLNLLIHDYQAHL